MKKEPKFTAGYEAVYELAHSILERMRAQNVTRADLARKLGVTPPVVTRFFSPGRNLTVFTAAMIAKVLGARLQMRLVDRWVATVPSAGVTTMTVPLLQHESIPPGQETFAFSSAEAQTIDQQDHGPEEQPHAIAA